jgi:hypothetical protein
MKVLSRSSGYAHNWFVVELGKADEGKSDHELITCVDNHCEYGKPVRHFGGEVTRRADGKVEIKVYTD